MFRKFFTRNIKSGARIRKTALLFRCGQSAGRPSAINLTMNCIACKDLQEENALFCEGLQLPRGTTGIGAFVLAYSTWPLPNLSRMLSNYGLWRR